MQIDELVKIPYRLNYPHEKDGGKSLLFLIQIIELI